MTISNDVDGDYFEKVVSWHSTEADWYAEGDLAQQILTRLIDSGKDPEALVSGDLADLDAWHIRKRPATQELMEWVDARPGEKVLDIGCGLGGSSRQLAASGCIVTGVDLLEEHCQAATMLAERLGLADRVNFQQGNAIDLPFADATFDVVWTEHCQFCFPEKERFLSGVRRVVKPGGRFAFHELFAGSRPGLHFPLPWAGEASISHAQPVQEFEQMLARVGFERVRWEDKTELSMAFFRKLLQNVRQNGWPPVSVSLLMGAESTEKFDNTLRNLQEERLVVIQAVMRRA